MNEKEKLITLLNEGDKIAGEKVHKSIYDYVKKYHHFSSKDDADKIPSMQELVADYLLNNGVIVPPVKVGDTVWYHDYVPTSRGLTRILRSSEVREITIGLHCSFVTLKSCTSLDLANIGKTIFLTKEDAEAAFND